MTRKQKRGVMIGGAVALLCLAGLLTLVALRDTIVYFYTPADVTAKHIGVGQRFRLGGLVASGSVKKSGNATTDFSVTDTIDSLPVTYHGVLPDLFREGQGVVAEGKLNDAHVFVADTVLAKHDENYMPPEVAKSLAARGVKLGESAHVTMPK